MSRVNAEALRALWERIDVGYRLSIPLEEWRRDIPVEERLLYGNPLRSRPWWQHALTWLWRRLCR